MTATESPDLGGGARSRETDGAGTKRGVMPARGEGPPPAASSVPRCAICGRPRDDAPAKPDNEHSPCDRTTRRMEADLASRRAVTTNLLAQPW